MEGDSLVIEPHHRAAATQIVQLLLPKINGGNGKFTLTIAGQSGSGKSETAAATAEAMAKEGKKAIILGQDDYFVYPPKTNDLARRQNISWVGPQEVNLDLLDRHLAAIRKGHAETVKPLIYYDEDMIKSENISLSDADIAIAEGTYTTLLNNADTRVFIDRTFEQTRAHREKRNRNAAELDPFIDSVLEIEHHIISSHKPRADIIINPDYSVRQT